MWSPVFLPSAQARSGVAVRLALAPQTSVGDRLERFENGWYSPHLPVPVLHVEGGIEDVARTHGLLLSRHPEMREPIEYFSSVIDRRLEASPKFANHRWLSRLLVWGYHHFIARVILDYLPDRYRAAFEAFARAAGLKPEIVLSAAVVPDAALRLRSLFSSVELQPSLPSGLGCTSVIWNAGPGSTLHGRNLDYDGVGYWNRFPLVLHVVPNEGLAYVSVTSAGIHAPGLTAFNEAGLTLAVHQLTLSDAQASGTPMPVISAEIVRNARSIDDAIAIIRGFPRAGTWAYVLSQGRDRAVIETSASDVVIRRSSEPFFFQTNHVSSPAFAAQQYFSTPGSWLDTFLRASRLSRVAQGGAMKEWATPERMAALLGSGHAPGIPSAGSRRVAGGTIAKLDNIQSVIMDAAHRRLWIAIGTDRRAPNENRYLEYRWGDMRSADEPEVTGAEVTVSTAESLGTTGARLRELLRQAVDQRRLDRDPGGRHALLEE